MKNDFDKNKIVYDDGEMQLTEEDIMHLKKSEEDIENGRVHTWEEIEKYFIQEHGVKFD